MMYALIHRMKRTQIYLDERQDDRLGARARSTGVTKSALIRAAIDAYLARGPEPSRVEHALEESFGSMPDIEVPDRSEWGRGYG